MRAVGEMLAGERGDRHRAFTLAINLHEAVAHDIQPLADVFNIHRPTAIQDGLESAGVGACCGDMVDHALDHRRRGEQGQPAGLRGQMTNLGRVEAARFGNHMPRGFQYMRKIAHAGPVRERRGIGNRVGRLHCINIGEIACRHGQQHAMAFHHALGKSGRARGIEQPGEIIRRAVLDGDRCRLQDRGVFACGRHEHLLDRGDAGSQRGAVRQQVGAGEQARGLGVFQDVGDLARVQFGIHRHGDQAGPQDAVEHLKVFRIVGHEDGHPFTLGEPERVAQITGDRCGACGQRAVIEQQAVAKLDGRMMRKDARATRQKLGNIHR